MDAKPYKQEKKENDIYLIPIVKPHTQTLIWLHGLGDSPLGYLDMFNSYESPIPFNFKIILLCAPKVKFTLYNNQITTSWFDLLEPGFRDEKSYNYSDVEKNKIKIINIIEEEVKLLNGNYKNIFIGGFSQGACLSLDIGFSYEKKLGGIISCSGVLFPQTNINDNNKDIKVFAAHGLYDNVIDINVSKKSYERILGFKNFEFHEYKMFHSIIEEECEDIGKFLK